MVFMVKLLLCGGVEGQSAGILETLVAGDVTRISKFPVDDNVLSTSVRGMLCQTEQRVVVDRRRRTCSKELL